MNILFCITKFQIFLIFLFPFSLFSFEKRELHNIIKLWEKENANKAIVLITSPRSGKIEYTNTEQSAFNRELPPGSILKTLSSFVLLAHSEKFLISASEKYFCNGKFEEPYLNYFKKTDKERFHLIEERKLNKTYFKCSKVNGHGEITMQKALAFSCNAYYLHFTSKNPNFFNRILISDWQLNKGTGASFERKQIRENLNHRNQSDFTNALTSIGDSGELNVTALKIAQVYGAILADTEILKPIRKGETPEEQSPFPYSESLRKEIQAALMLAVKEGTLKNLILKNSNVKILAGKSGTPTQRGEKVITHGWNILYYVQAGNTYLLTVFTEKGSANKETLDLSKLILNSI